MSPDGTGTLEVDSYKSGCLCGSEVAISGDGNTVVSSDATQVRVVGANGTNAKAPALPFIPFARAEVYAGGQAFSAGLMLKVPFVGSSVLGMRP